jgi:outer membrane protein assembly factor BamB
MKLFISIFILLFSFLDLMSQSEKDWPIYRGKPDLAGKSDFEIASNPKLLWSLATGTRTKSSPVINNGTIFFGNEKGELIAITPDGEIKWKYESRSPIEAPPLSYGDMVVFGASDGFLRSVDKNSGKLIWSYLTENQIAGSANFWENKNKAGIVVGSYDYCLHCVDPITGKQKWKVETENFINGAPAVSGNMIVFGGCDGFIRVIDPETGRQKDSVEVGVYIAASPALSGGRAYFGDYDGTLYCIDLTSDKTVWKTEAAEGSGSIIAVPAVSHGLVIVGNEDKYIYCYNASDGKLKWKFRTNGAVTGSAVIVSDKILFASTDGNIYLLRQSDGTRIWNFYSGSSISSSPAIIKDNFIILTDDGRVLSFGEKTSLQR